MPLPIIEANLDLSRDLFFENSIKLQLESPRINFLPSSLSRELTEKERK